MECSTCSEFGDDNNYAPCAKSNRACNHHCNCIWTQDRCCWCGIEVNEEGNLMRKITDHIVSGDQAVQLEITVTDQPGAGGANHRYIITGMSKAHNPSCIESDCDPGHGLVEVVLFQNGPIKEVGVNGSTGEAHIAIEIDRLRSFQRGPYACSDNQEALEHFEAGLRCLQRRTLARIARGVEGTHEK